MKRIVIPTQEDMNKYADEIVHDSRFQLKGTVRLNHYRKGELIHSQIGDNTFTTEGMAMLLNTMFGTTSKAGSAIFYVGIFHTNVTPGVSDTAAVCLGATGTYGESQDADYTPNTNKPGYTIASTATATCTNTASPAVFTIVVASVTIYGAFLSTAVAKTATSGTLMAAKKFGTARAVITADVLSVTYSITCTTS